VGDPPEAWLPLDLGALLRVPLGMATVLLLIRIVPAGSPGSARCAISPDWRSKAAGRPRCVASLARVMVPAERSGTISTALNGAPLTSFSPGTRHTPAQYFQSNAHHLRWSASQPVVT
jgi:hypothetical protein